MTVDMTAARASEPTPARPSRAVELRARLEVLKQSLAKQTQSIQASSHAAATAMEAKFQNAKQHAAAKDAAIDTLTEALAACDLHMQRMSAQAFNAASSALSILQQFAGWGLERDTLGLQASRLVQRLGQVKVTVTQALKEAEKGGGPAGAGAAKLQSVQLGLGAVEAMVSECKASLDGVQLYTTCLS